MKSARRNYIRRRNRRYFKRLKLVDLPLEILYKICQDLDLKGLGSMFRCVKGLRSNLTSFQLNNLGKKFLVMYPQGYVLFKKGGRMYHGLVRWFEWCDVCFTQHTIQEQDYFFGKLLETRYYEIRDEMDDADCSITAGEDRDYDDHECYRNIIRIETA